MVNTDKCGRLHAQKSNTKIHTFFMAYLDPLSFCKF